MNRKEKIDQFYSGNVRKVFFGPLEDTPKDKEIHITYNGAKFYYLDPGEEPPSGKKAYGPNYQNNIPGSETFVFNISTVRKEKVTCPCCLEDMRPILNKSYSKDGPVLYWDGECPNCHAYGMIFND